MNRNRNRVARRGALYGGHAKIFSIKAALWPVALCLIGFLLAACSDAPATDTPAPIPTATLAPLPTLTVKIPAIKTHLYAFESESVQLDSFTSTGGAIEPIGNDLLVVTPSGKIALISPDGAVEYLDGLVPMNDTGPESSPISENPDFNLHGIRVADILLKEIAGRYTLFVTHHYFTGECVRFRLSSTTLVRAERKLTVLPDWRTIFDAEPCMEETYGWQNAGGKILTDGPGHLLVTIGNHTYGQRPIPANLHIGKLVRIEIETGEAEIVATGIRNSQGLARDAEGNLWATDHGPQGGDELNLLREGADYGWPQASYGIGYDGVSLWLVEDEDTGQHDGFERPVFAWVAAPAVSAIAVNDGRRLPLWKDDLLVVSLVAQSLFRIRRQSADVQYVEKIKLGYRIRDITLMPDGRIALLRDGNSVYFLSRSLRYCNEDSRGRRDVYSINCEFIAASPKPSEPDTSGIDTSVGARLFGLHCSVCHNLNAERHGAGPHLAGVTGRPAGRVIGYDFSNALSSLNVVWDEENLARFLAAPQQFAPGTSMPSSGLTESQALAIADYISSPGSSTDSVRDSDYLAELVRDRQPEIRSTFDVYLNDNTLIYVKEQCVEDDLAAWFFLAVYPVDADDLPEHRKQHGFDNLDFTFARHGAYFDGICLADVPLPEYPIAEISTGQYVQVDGGFNHLWEGEIRP